MAQLLTTVPSLDTMRADDLVAQDMPPIRMVVGDYIPAGLLLLAGDPKAGKSLLMQDLALSIARGEPAWGCLPVDEGDVLYLANEGGLRSFRERLLRMIEGDCSAAPTRFRIATSSEPLGDRLEIQLEWWLSQANDPRLVVIDTYSSVAPDTRGVNRHQEDYNALSGLADLASRYPDTLVAVVHHTRKAESEDVMHRISGSQGMTAATDGNAVLSRHTAARQCVLSIRPRNAEESDLVIERSPETLRWRIVGDDERSQLSEGRQRILEWLEAHPAGGSPKDIAEGLSMTHDNVRQFLTQMKAARQVSSLRRGHYVAGSQPTTEAA